MAKPIQALRAAYAGNLASMAEALTGKGVKQAANRVDQTGRSTLTCATAGRTGDETASQCVRLLLGAGADPNLADSYGQVPLHFAARFGRPRCIDALIDGGARVDLPMLSGTRPIHQAILTRSVPAIWALIRAGADMALADRDGLTPLEFARSLKPDTGRADDARRLAEAIDALELEAAMGPGDAPMRSMSL